MRRLTSPALAALLVLAYTLFTAALAFRQHEAFHTHAFDMAYFDNVIWNTSQGRLFLNDLPDKPRIFLGEHFSPALIVLAPLYWLWPDPRVLLFAQSFALALSVVPCYALVRKRHTHLALLVMLALYLNPALLGIALSEFHEIALAAPLLCLGLWALLEKKYAVMFGSLLGALLFKEELAVIVAAIGVLLIVVRPRRVLLGLLLLALALTWLVFVWGLLPSLLPDATSHWQVRYGDVAPTPWQGLLRLLSDPAFLWSRYASASKLLAMVRVLWPLAFLPVLAPQIALLSAPVFAYLLLSNKLSVSQLQFWYVAPLLPILFVATAQAVARAPQRAAQTMTLLLLLASGAAYWLIGAGPFARAYEPERFALGARDECARQLLSLIPANASLSAQDNLLPHLAHRRALYVFPSLGEPLAEYVALDTRYAFVGGYSNWPLFRPAQVPGVVNRFIAQPSYALVGDGCDYKILRHTGEPRFTSQPAQTFAQRAQLLGYELAVADEMGIYHPLARAPQAGAALRVSLWWQAAAPLDNDYTVFVHALSADGQLVGQHDSAPANGFRPTSQWTSGEILRDVHYFALEQSARQILVGLYDPRTGPRLRLADGADAVPIPLAP